MDLFYRKNDVITPKIGQKNGIFSKKFRQNIRTLNRPALAKILDSFPTFIELIAIMFNHSDV